MQMNCCSDSSDLRWQPHPHSWMPRKNTGPAVHCKGIGMLYLSPTLKKQRPSSKHISFLRLLNKLKDDDFVSHMLYKHVFFLVLFIFLALAFMAHTYLHNLSYCPMPRFACPAEWTLFPLLLLPHKEITPTSLPPICILYILKSQISKAVTPSGWSLPWLSC